MIYSLYALKRLDNLEIIDNIAIMGIGNMDIASNYFSTKHRDYNLTGYFTSFVKTIDTFDMQKRKIEQLKFMESEE